MSDDSSLSEDERDYWEAVGLAVHPAMAPQQQGAGAARRAAQHALRLFDRECSDLNYARKEAALESLRESARYSGLYHEEYVAAFERALTAALTQLREAGTAYLARLQEAEHMRKRGAAAAEEAERRALSEAALIKARGVAEQARCEQEARRLESYAAKHRHVRLADARYK